MSIDIPTQLTLVLNSVRTLHMLNSESRSKFQWLNPLQPEARAKIISACKTLESNLWHLETLCPGFLEKGIFQRTVEYQQFDKNPLEEDRVLCTEVSREIRRVYRKLSFHEGIWHKDFPYTDILVNGLSKGQGLVNYKNWKGGWVFPDLEGSGNVKWVRASGKRLG